MAGRVYNLRVKLNTCKRFAKFYSHVAGIILLDWLSAGERTISLTRCKIKILVKFCAGHVTHCDDTYAAVRLVLH